MEEKKFFTVQDENGLQMTAELLTVLQIDGKNYAVYSISKDVDTSDVYIARIIKDKNGNYKFISVFNEDEREKVFGIIDNMIDKC